MADDDLTDLADQLASSLEETPGEEEEQNAAGCQEILMPTIQSPPAATTQPTLRMKVKAKKPSAIAISI